MTSGPGRAEIEHDNWGGCCVTSVLGRMKMETNNCLRFLCDTWAVQGGNGCK